MDNKYLLHYLFISILDLNAFLSDYIVFMLLIKLIA